MNKNNLQRFIQKYSLGGVIESVAWNAEGNKLSVRFISDDKTMLGEVDFNGFTSKPFNVGIYTTSLLKNLLGILDNDLSLFERSFWKPALSVGCRTTTGKK